MPPQSQPTSFGTKRTIEAGGVPNNKLRRKEVESNDYSLGVPMQAHRQASARRGGGRLQPGASPKAFAVILRSTLPDKSVGEAAQGRE